MKVISGGSLVCFAKIWLNELLGLTVFGVGCSDCYVISIYCVVCYKLDNDVKNVCLCEFVYVYCIKRLAHVQSYNCSALWRPWIVKNCCDLVTDVVQSSVC